MSSLPPHDHSASRTSHSGTVLDGARVADLPDDSGARTAATDRHSVVAREKSRYGGIKWGAAFFGWLTATGTAVILTAVLVAAGTAVGVATDATTAEASQNAGTLGVVGALALLAVLLIAYYCGG